jgi:hypothetical protein
VKAIQELYSIRFNKVATKDDIHVTTYTLGVPIMGSGVLVIPLKIELKEDKIITTFDNKTSHVIFYEAGVELFYREKETKKKDGSNK